MSNGVEYHDYWIRGIKEDKVFGPHFQSLGTRRYSYPFFACKSALDSRRYLQTWTRSFQEEQCSGASPSLNIGIRISTTNKNTRHALSKNVFEGRKSCLSFACKSALDSTRKRQTSRWPLKEDWWSGVEPPLNTRKWNANEMPTKKTAFGMSFQNSSCGKTYTSVACKSALNSTR